MEQLPQTAISRILASGKQDTLNSLSRTSRSLTNEVVNLTKGGYQWKLMTESYLQVDIPYKYNDWEGVYKFVTLIGDQLDLLYIKDVFHAKLALLINVPLDSLDSFTINDVLRYAQLETVEFLLTVPEFKKACQDIEVIVKSMERRKEEITMLLLEDGKWKRNMRDFIKVVKGSLEHGCGNVFIYLADKYQDDVGNVHPSIYYKRTCCYGLEDVAAKILEIEAVSDRKLENGEYILEFIRTGIEPEYIDEDDSEENGIIDISSLVSIYDIYAMIKAGYTEQAHQLLSKEKYTNGELYSSMSIGLENGTITGISQLEPYISTRPEMVPNALLHEIISSPNHDPEMIAQIAAYVPRDMIAEFIKDTLALGEWKYAEAMSKYR